MVLEKPALTRLSFRPYVACHEFNSGCIALQQIVKCVEEYVPAAMSGILHILQEDDSIFQMCTHFTEWSQEVALSQRETNDKYALNAPGNFHVATVIDFAHVNMSSSVACCQAAHIKAISFSCWLSCILTVNERLQFASWIQFQFGVYRPLQIAVFEPFFFLALWYGQYLFEKESLLGNM